MTPSEKVYKIAAKCLKPIENQIYEADRQKVIEAIIQAIENARATIVVDENSLKPVSLFDGLTVEIYSPGDRLMVDGSECVITEVGEHSIMAEAKAFGGK